MTSLETTAKALEVAGTIVSKLGWMKKVYSNFAPFNPDLRNMEVSFRSREAVVRMYIHIPDSIRRKVRRKITIPKFPGLDVGMIRDETFREYHDLWQLDADGKKWVIKGKNLPSGEHFLFEFSGKLPPRAMQYLVRIQPSANRDTDGAYDKYWLNSMIRDVSIVEKIWDELTILDVDVKVEVNIQQLVKTIIPPDMRKEIKAFMEFIQIARIRKSRPAEIMRARAIWLKSSEKKIPLDDFIEKSKRLTIPSFFNHLLKVDNPYKKLEITCGKLIYGFIPERIRVNLATDLNLDHPAATGYLRFHREEYKNKIENFIEDSYNRALESPKKRKSLPKK